MPALVLQELFIIKAVSFSLISSPISLLRPTNEKDRCTLYCQDEIVEKVNLQPQNVISFSVLAEAF